MTRDEKGKFVKGNPGGGRKKRPAEVAYFDAFKAEVTVDDLRTMVKKLKEQAIRGDRDAIKLIMAYLMGLPVQRTELTGEDGKAIVIKVKNSYDANL